MKKQIEQIKKIKIVEFYKNEYDGPRNKIMFAACLSGISSAMLVVLINQAAEIASRQAASIQLSLGIFYILACVTTIFSKRYTLYQTGKMTERILRKVRVRMINKLRHTELQFFERTEKGEIYSRIVQDTQIISQSAPNLINTVDSALTGLFVLLYVAFISVTGFIVAVISIVAMYAIFFADYAKIKDQLKIARMKEAGFLELLNDIVLGFKEIKINSKKNQMLYSDIETLSLEVKKNKISAENRYDKNIVFFITLFLIALAMITFVLPIFIHSHRQSLIKIVTAFLFVLGMLTIVFRGIYTIIKANVAVESLKKLENKIDEYGSTPMLISDVYESYKEFKTITLQSVAFHYTGAKDEVLFGVGPINLTLKQGETVFIIGGNGSGKSTMLKLLTGLYYPMSDGYITVDDNRVTRINYQNYRELFSTIFTDFHLFKKLYGLENLNDKNVNQLLKEMDIHKKTQYKDGRFTNIDLSTGQRKRLAYIVSVLEDKPIYVFDEWAADQDPIFRSNFYDHFLMDLKLINKTVIAVTHDDKYFDKADRVLKMEEGQIKELRKTI